MSRNNPNTKREYDRRYRLTHKETMDARVRAWHKDNAEHVASYKRELNYGITKEEHDSLLLKQGGVCAICGYACQSGRKLSVDHDHNTGQVRGLLCLNCNTGIGKFSDNWQTLEKAVNYLKRT